MLIVINKGTGFILPIPFGGVLVTFRCIQGQDTGTKNDSACYLPNESRFAALRPEIKSSHTTTCLMHLNVIASANATKVVRI
jgi:hypothetical protein